MIVVDASALLDLLLLTPRTSAIEAHLFTDGASLHAPHLIDLEISQVLRRHVAQGYVDAERARASLSILSGLAISRHPHTPLLPRIWALRHNLTAYDAAYIALAEALDAPLLTCDGRLARSAGHLARIELI